MKSTSKTTNKTTSKTKNTSKIITPTAELVTVNLITLITNYNQEKYAKISLNTKKNKDNKEALDFLQATILSESYINLILLYLYGFYYKTYLKELFLADFKLNNVGVIDESYVDRDFNKFTITLKDKEITFIKNTLDKLLQISYFGLINNDLMNQIRTKSKTNITKNIIQKVFSA